MSKAATKFKIGEKVILKRGAWGLKNGATTLVDVVGIIVSKKGTKGHSNVHRYAVQHKHGISFTDGYNINKYNAK